MELRERVEVKLIIQSRAPEEGWYIEENGCEFGGFIVRTFVYGTE